jgi:hypothetical protein
VRKYEKARKKKLSYCIKKYEIYYFLSNKNKEDIHTQVAEEMALELEKSMKSGQREKLYH